MARDHSEKYLERWCEAGLDQFLADMCPSRETLPLAAQCVAETINTAHSHNPDSWEITKYPKHIRLNVGLLEAAVWGPKRDVLRGLHPPARAMFPERPFLALMVDMPMLKEAGALRHVEAFLLKEYRLNSVPASCYVAIPTTNPQEFTRLHELVRDAHLKHLAYAAQTRRNPGVTGSHHPGLVDAIAILAGHSLPQPSYVHVTRPPGLPRPSGSPLPPPPVPRIRLPKKVLRDITERRGQPEFREKLLLAYDRRCAVTDCNAEAALEAAHIRRYAETGSQDVTDGMLLRADIHTLFDLGLVRINPKTLRVDLAPELQESCYRDLQGRQIRLPEQAAARPSVNALEERWVATGEQETGATSQ